MKVVQINCICDSGSTGKICVSISKMLSSKGVENYILHTSNNSTYPNGIQYMSVLEVKIQAAIAKIFGRYGFVSKHGTNKLIRILDNLEPTIIHLHNIHGHNINLELLFSYLKKKKIKTFWTFHDCFAFTGYCMYFDLVKCNKWITQCKNCPQYKKYSIFFDNSENNYKKKKEILTNSNFTIITPSKWLSEIVKKSFLCNHPIKIVNNGIDLSIFKPRNDVCFRKKYGISSQTIVLLGVANNWENRKGLDVFISLSEKLDRQKFTIVLVGKIDSKQKRLLNTIIIPKISNQMELSVIYSSADYFINPTREDNFPTVNIESLACGTPVITFDTGGSPEILDDTCGVVIKCDDIDGIIKFLNSNKTFSADACINKASEFNHLKVYQEYYKLYNYNKFD